MNGAYSGCKASISYPPTAQRRLSQAIAKIKHDYPGIDISPTESRSVQKVTVTRVEVPKNHPQDTAVLTDAAGRVIERIGPKMLLLSFQRIIDETFASKEG
jgi:hypothetical protein